MQTKLLSFIKALSKGDRVTFLLSGIVVEGTFEALEQDNYVMLSQASYPSIDMMAENYLTIPAENILAWGAREKK